MEAVHAPSPEAEAAQPIAGEGANERRCLVTGEMLAKAGMVRFVVGPANEVVPDLAENLPGRGLWVKADYAAIAEAAKKGLFAKAAKAPAKAAPDLSDQVIRLLRTYCLNFIGLGKAAGVAVLGETQVEEALRASKLALLLLAKDAKGDLPGQNPIPTCRLFGREELGQALGYAQIVYAGFKPHGLTKRLAAEIGRLTKLQNTSPHKQENE